MNQDEKDSRKKSDKRKKEKVKNLLNLDKENEEDTKKSEGKSKKPKKDKKKRKDKDKDGKMNYFFLWHSLNVVFLAKTKTKKSSPDLSLRDEEDKKLAMYIL